MGPSEGKCQYRVEGVPSTLLPPLLLAVIIAPWLSFGDTPVFWPGEFHGLCSPWGRKELDTTERLSLSSGEPATFAREKTGCSVKFELQI